MEGRQRHRDRRLAGRQRGRGRPEHRRREHVQAGGSPLGAVPDGPQGRAGLLLLRRERLPRLRRDTGVPKLDPANDTATDSHGQILAHKTWDGRSAQWSAPVVDVAGTDPEHGRRQDGDRRRAAGHDERRPDHGRQVAAHLRVLGRRSQHQVRARRRPAEVLPRLRTGKAVTSLPVDAGSRPLATGGSPVIIRLPDGRLVYNAAAAATSGSTRADAATARGRSTRRPRGPATAATCSTSRAPAASPSSTTRAPRRSPTPRSTSATRTAPTTSW